MSEHLEAGKGYKTFGGDEVRIHATDAGGNCPAIGDCLNGGVREPESWTMVGKYFWDEPGLSHMDIDLSTEHDIEAPK